MAKLRAVLLAAGRGVRMGGERPKSLIPLDDKEPPLYYLLKALEKNGIQDLLVITGFGFQAVEAYVTDRSESFEVAFVRNTRFASWGNFHSVRMALDQSPGMDVLVLNSDIVIAPAVLERAVAPDADLVLAVQRRRRLEAEDMRVELNGAMVRAIGKDIKMVRSHGEFCGVSLIRPRAARAYGDIATSVQWRAETALYYEDVYARMLTDIEARATAVEDGEYAEVDSPEDVAGAVAVVERHEQSWS
ncbi:MAG: NTP transferase domain-containing protein [Actinomycetota bacterium]|nr:NTP transferase domain-containing protein [Actinomycetota bacterium]